MAGRSILGGAMLPHAPQFFTQPESEDKATIARVREVAATIGARLRALKPDVWIVIANDHAEQFFHNVAPPFTIHVGGRAQGEFAGRKFDFRVAGEVGFALVRELYRDNFDPAYTSTARIDYALGIPMTHLGLGPDDPVLPIYVNAYLPPQPTMERCFQFGRALARALDVLGVRAAVVSSGGMSHFPGTDRYSQPDLAWDEAALVPMRRGNLMSLLGYDEKTLDDTGNIELRCWGVCAGALGERTPDVVQLDPSWHHNYASLGFWTPVAATTDQPHYPQIAPALVPLTAALHALSTDPAARRAYLDDPRAYATSRGLAGDHATWLVAYDTKPMVTAGVHPLVPFLARLQLDRDRATRGTPR
jgi:2,3-dihydroxyphenylpropionate 1,2-dioxygenase